MWSRGRLTKVQTTTRPDHVWPEVWTKIGKAAQNPEKQERKNEKRNLDNARRLRGIYFIAPDDQAYKETLNQQCEEKIGKTFGSSHAVQKESLDKHHQGGCKAGNCTPKDSQNDLWLYSGISCTQGKEWNLLFATHCRQRFTSSQFGSQMYSDATSDEDSRCISCSGRGMAEA